MSGKVTCRDCAEFLADYVAGDLPADVREVFETHLQKCRNCQSYLDQYSTVIAAGKRACQQEDQAAAQSFPEELVQAILLAQAKRQPEHD